MGVKVTFLGEEPAQQKQGAEVLVPKPAVRDQGGQPVVYIYREGKVERRAVRPGATRGNDQELMAGVSAGGPGGRPGRRGAAAWAPTTRPKTRRRQRDP